LIRAARAFSSCFLLLERLLQKITFSQPVIVQNTCPPLFLLLIGLLSQSCLSALAERCVICREEIAGDTVYLLTDRVTKEKAHACLNCAKWPDVCTMCGLPVRKDFLSLTDGRFLCDRDSKTAIVDPIQALQICGEVRDQVDKLFSRFISFPTNMHVQIVDRVDLLALFRAPDEDYQCPHVLGYFRAATNDDRRIYEINVLSALKSPQLKETCAHEYTHAWVFENVPSIRKKVLSRDAEEGFCELVGYLLMDSQNEEELKHAILRNNYTHGQIDLFIETEKRFGFNDVVEWMKYGLDSKLEPTSPENIRKIKVPQAGYRELRAPVVENPHPPPDKLQLKGISWTKARQLALINNQSFAPGESGRVLVGTTNIAIRCLLVRETSVRIQILASGQELELSLSGGAK